MPDKARTMDDPSKMSTEQWAIYRQGREAGIRQAAGFVEQWDQYLAIGTNGYRMSDIILCKFNVIRRKKPRKVRP